MWKKVNKIQVFHIDKEILNKIKDSLADWEDSFVLIHLDGLKMLKLNLD